MVNHTCIFLEPGAYGQGYNDPDFCWFNGTEVVNCPKGCFGYVNKASSLNDLAQEIKKQFYTEI